MKKQYWADFVFEQDYKLTPLKEVEAYIKNNRHLEGIPTQKEIAKNGYQQHEINKKFLEKIEELTLYKIKQHQLIEANKLRIEEQNKQILKIKALLSN